MVAPNTKTLFRALLYLVVCNKVFTNTELRNVFCFGISGIVPNLTAAYLSRAEFSYIQTPIYYIPMVSLKIRNCSVEFIVMRVRVCECAVAPHIHKHR